MSSVRVENATKDYQLGRTTVPALRGVALAVERGEFMSIAGPSGSGKTTLLNLIGCLDTPTAGTVLIDGRRTWRRSATTPLTDLRADKIGFIFQTFNLIPVLSAFENVEFPLLAASGGQRAKAERARPGPRALEEVGLAELARHRPNELSGGQRQRVAVARALVTDPADRPRRRAHREPRLGDRPDDHRPDAARSTAATARPSSSRPTTRG